MFGILILLQVVLNIPLVPIEIKRFPEPAFRYQFNIKLGNFEWLRMQDGQYHQVRERMLQ